MDSYRTPISSKQVSEFMPLNLWTEVILISNKNDTFIITTEEKIIKRTDDMKKIVELSTTFKKVQDFKPSQMVAVEVEGEWCRGKLISHNEYKSENTIIELIDFGSFLETKLENVFYLPYLFTYGQLALPIQFQCIIQKTNKLTIKPNLCKSKLYEGIVFVDVKCNNIKIDKFEAEKRYLDPEIELPISIRQITIPRKQKQKKISLRNGDCCIIQFVEDMSIYVAKVIKNEVTSKYVLWQYEIVQDTFESTDKIHKVNPLVGDKVKVFCPLKGGFFRAKILKKNICDSFDIFFIDYGNKKTIFSNEIYQLADKLHEPGLAVEVKVKSFQTNYNYDTFIKSGKPFVIEFDVTSKNRLENVKFKEIGNGSYINNNQFTVDCLAKNLATKTKVKQINECSKLVNDHNSGYTRNIKKYEIVYLSHFEAMDEVYVIKNITQFNEINRIIQNCTVREHEFIEGDIVCIITVCGKYRARILHKISSLMVYVLCIDYGFHETVNTTSIFKLHNKNIISTLNLEKVAGLACRVRLKGSHDIGKSLPLIKFVNNIQGVPLLMEFNANIEGCEEVVLRRNDNHENIFDEFIHNNTFGTISTESTISNTTENNEVMNDIKRCLSNNFENVTLKNGDYCIVSHFQDFENIFLCKAVKNYADVYEMHNMDIISKTSFSKDLKMKSNQMIGDFVKVHSPAYQQLRRAKIIDVKENDCFHVSYIDFGGTEVVNSHNIFELSMELSKMTELPVRVSIEVPPNVTKTDKIEKLFKNLKQKALVLSTEFKKPNTNGLGHVILKELESDNSINNQILELSLENLAIRNGDCCILTYFENFDCIYISKGHELENKNMLNSIKNTTDWKLKVNPVVGDIVIVNSSVFNELFRAKIINSKNNDFHVFFIDYGDTEVVGACNIYEIPDNFKNMPGLAIKIGMNIFCNEIKLVKVQILFQSLALEEEPLSIEFDEFSEDGLKSCILKVISTDLNINNEVLKLIKSSIP